MKKLIKQDILILLSLAAAYHPEAEKSIEAEAGKLTMQDTRDYLFLLRDGQCRISPYAEVFRTNGPEYQFWIDEPQDPASVRALHLHLTRRARDSPDGSAVVLDFPRMQETVENIHSMPYDKRQAAINSTIHYSLTHTTLCSTADFIGWLKGGDPVWT